MAASDYIDRGTGPMCPVGTLGFDVGVLTTTFNITAFLAIEGATEGDLEVGMAALIDDEIVRVDSIELPDITVARGCADTVPAAHLAGATVWFFSNRAGTDNREYLGGETIGVKASPFTFSGDPVPLEYTPPLELTFNWRFLRPYPPANFKCKGTPWFDEVKVTGPADTGLIFTWVHRDRLVQADQLVSHGEASVGPEPGTTYTARVYDDADNLVRTVTDIAGTSWEYPRADALADLPGLNGYIDLCSTRDLFDSWQIYRTLIQVSLGGLGEVLGENLGG